VDIITHLPHRLPLRIHPSNNNNNNTILIIIIIIPVSRWIEYPRHRHQEPVATVLVAGLVLVVLVVVVLQQPQDE
jgi:hypothetical protein